MESSLLPSGYLPGATGQGVPLAEFSTVVCVDPLGDRGDGRLAPDRSIAI